MDHQCALITGASSGLGREFARQLAAQSRELILVARRRERLEELADELQSQHPHLSVTVLPVDLISPDARHQFLRDLHDLGKTPDLLVNNAGIGDYGDFLTADWEKTRQMMSLNIDALVHLSHALLPGLVARRGGIINVSSLAGDLPIPDFAVYAATKAFVSSFSEALRLETKDLGVRVLAVCPGPVPTEFGSVARRQDEAKEMSIRQAFYVSAPLVVSGALTALSYNQPRHYPSYKIALAAGLIGLLPLAALRLVMGRRPRRQA